MSRRVDLSPQPSPLAGRARPDSPLFGAGLRPRRCARPMVSLLCRPARPRVVPADGGDGSGISVLKAHSERKRPAVRHSCGVGRPAHNKCTAVRNKDVSLARGRQRRDSGVQTSRSLTPTLSPRGARAIGSCRCYSVVRRGSPTPPLRPTDGLPILPVSPAKGCPGRGRRSIGRSARRDESQGARTRRLGRFEKQPLIERTRKLAHTGVSAASVPGIGGPESDVHREPEPQEMCGCKMFSTDELRFEASRYEGPEIRRRAGLVECGSGTDSVASNMPLCVTVLVAHLRRHVAVDQLDFLGVVQ